MFETIVALATPPMKSALAIIRCSGDDCFEVVSKCFTSDLKKLKERKIFFGKIKENNSIIDEVILLAYKAPKSFTGEDSVEIISHGSMLVVNEILRVLIACGARMATNGEFSSRAFLHGKMDLVQAESVNDLINSTTIEAKNLSLLSLEGKTSEAISPIKTKIADLISLIEVNIDYPEYEDIEQANKEKIYASCSEIIENIENLIKDGRKAKIIHDGVKVAIVGKPNVGKSSLLNAMINEEKAIVTDIAGTTRDIVEGDLVIKGVKIHLLDTAGIREINDKVESIGVDKAKKALKEADIVVVVLDSSSKLNGEDEYILEATKDLNRIIVYNKVDLSKKVDGIAISAKDKNINSLLDAIYENIGIEEKVYSTPALSNDRQIGLLEKARLALIKAREDAMNDLTVDLISVSLLEAYTSVLEIVGEANQIDIAKEIFSRFCVGK